MKNKGLLGFLFFAFAAILFITASTAQAATPFPIAASTGKEWSISAAFDGTNYLVGIRGDAGAQYNITAQLIDQSGNLVGSRISTGRTGGSGISTGRPGGIPFVSFDGTNYLMVWEDDAASPNDVVYGQFISTSGSGVGSPFPIAGLGTNGDIEGLVYTGGNYLVVYTQEVNSLTADSIVYGRIVSTSGVVGSEFAISSGYGDFGFHNTAFDGTNFFVVWTDDSNDSEVKGRFISPAGVLGIEISINASAAPSDNPLTVVFDGTNYLVVWTDEVGVPGSGEWDVFGQIVTPSGSLLGNVITISTAPGQQFVPVVAFDGTNYLVTWTDMRNDANHNWTCDSGEGTCWDIYGQYIDKTGALVGSEFVINSGVDNQGGGAVSFKNGKYLALINNIDILTNDGAVGDVYGEFLGTVPSYTLTVTKSGTGTGTVTSNPAGIDCAGDCNEVYNAGTVATLIATPDVGSSFAGWSGDADCSDGQVTMDSDKPGTATFNLVQYTLTVSKAGAGSGTVTSSPVGINCGADCTEPYNYNTVVTLTAGLISGSSFAGWSGACTGTGACTVTMDAAKTVTATFNLMITVTLVPDSTSIPRGGTLGYTVTATNNTSSSQTFKYWTYVILPNGSRYPVTGELFGPVTVTLSSGQVRSAHLTHGIPNSAPLGTYTYYGNVWPYPVVWDSDSFTFTVTSTASPGTRQKWELLENGLTK